jgi:hypothetical protein
MPCASARRSACLASPMRGEPFWQTAFLFAGAIFLLLQTWRGWRAGLFRSAVNFAAILVSVVFGLLAAELAAAPFGGLRYLLGFLAGVVVGGGLGCFLFFAIWLVGAITFKQTEHYAFGPVRFIWKVGGALFGFLIGLAVLLGSISIVRSLGAFAESRVEGTESAEAPIPHARLAVGLVTLKKSLELGPAGRFLASADPLPAQFYELAAQIGTLTSDQAKMVRFLNYPGIQEVLQNPRVVNLSNDPDFVRAWQEKNVWKIFNNQAVAAALKDPVVAEQLRKVDLSAALKFALEPPPTSPSPPGRKHR